jgi:hypothetical protein
VSAELRTGEMLYECSNCEKSYAIEQEAKDCCKQIIWSDEGKFGFVSKAYEKPFIKQHCCPNVTYGKKPWNIWLKIEEECPMCDYAYRPR